MSLGRGRQAWLEPWGRAEGSEGGCGGEVKGRRDTALDRACEAGEDKEQVLVGWRGQGGCDFEGVMLHVLGVRTQRLEEQGSRAGAGQAERTAHGRWEEHTGVLFSGWQERRKVCAGRPWRLEEERGLSE